MKIVQTNLLLIFLISLTIVNLKESITKRSTTETANHATTSTTAASTVSASNSSAKGKPVIQKGKHTNSIGLKVDINVVLDKYPFMITRCDQLVLFKAKYISDMGDYRTRKEGFFTISAYYVNQFRDKDAKHLDQSVLLTESTTKASHLRGARGCIVVSGGKHRQDIAMCLSNKKQAKNILAVLREFEKCRMGDDLKPIDADLIRRLIRACGKNAFKLLKEMRNKNKNKNKSAKKDIKVSKKLRKFSNNPWFNDRKNHFHPAKLAVPGAR